MATDVVDFNSLSKFRRSVLKVDLSAYTKRLEFVCIGLRVHFKFSCYFCVFYSCCAYVCSSSYMFLFHRRLLVLSLAPCPSSSVIQCALTLSCACLWANKFIEIDRSIKQSMREVESSEWLE